MQRIAEIILSDLKPVNRLMPERRLVFLLVAIACAAAALGAVMLGAAGWHALHWVQRFAVFACLAGDVGLMAHSLGRQIVPGARLLVSPRLLVAAALAAMAVIFFVLFRPNPEPAFVATGLVCLRIGLTFAIPAGVLAWLLLRRGAILNPALTGLTVGAFAGCSGFSVLEVFCPNLNVNHILAWHLGAAVVSVLLGLAVGRMAEWLQVRSSGARSR